MPQSGSKNSVPFYQTEIPSAPIFELEEEAVDLKKLKKDNLVIEIKEETRSSKVSSDDGRKTRVSNPSEIHNNSFEDNT